MPRLVGDDPIVIDDDSEDEIALYRRRLASPQPVTSTSSEDVLILDDNTPDAFPDDISEQTLNIDADDFLSEELAPGVMRATFDDEPPDFDVLSSDAGFVTTNGSPVVIDLPISTLINPRSVAVNYTPPMPVSRERHAVDVLARLTERVSLQPGSSSDARDNDKASGPEFVYIDLDDFEIYIHAAGSRNRLRSLHFLGAGKNSNNRMYFDGVLSVGSTKFYVQKVPFDKAPVDMYGTEFDTVQGNISIRSVLNEGREVYYRLRQPSTVYARFYYPYLWVADLGKHFIDFVDKVTDRNRDVRISHFRLHFAKWLHKTHGRSPNVAAWRKRYGAGRDDFGPAVIAYGDYLRREASAIFGPRFTKDLGFFRETSEFTFYKTHLPRVPAGHPIGADGEPSKPLPTVVTPYMYHMFKDLAIGPYLESTPGNHSPKHINGGLILPQKRRSFITGLPSLVDNERGKIQPGDLISTLPDGVTTGSKWSASAEKSEFWYALVHRVIEPQRPCGQRSFDVVWLYRPEHTPCGDMKFPWAKELFMCDHCTCGEDDDDDNNDSERANANLEDEVVAVHSVEWFGGPDTTADFFIRQTYLHGERSWVQLRLGHIFCKDSVSEAVHQSAFTSHFGTSRDPVESVGVFENEPNYVVGDTVLAALSKKNKRSEPYEIQEIIDTKPANSHGQPSLLTGYRLRRLLRRNEADPDAPNAPPNELLYTDETVFITKESRIIGRCVVRIFPNDTKKIPTPYNRGGAGNIFYMMHRLEKTAKTIVGDIPGASLRNNGGDYEIRVVPLDAAKYAPNLRQGFDPATPVPRLRALELFCGCGNLGRGIEDAGATETRCANDIWPVAIHTFMANVASPDTVQPFIGSADTLLERAIRHSASALSAAGIPIAGDIDFISGGSPCQGFSNLTKDKEAHKQYKNRSMVASFASFVDLYRPKFGILENVAAIVNNGKKGSEQRREDIFGQLICSLLGLGYQLRIMLGNAWSYGAPQQRQRVFLIFAAPGFQLPDIPLPSHGSEIEGLVRSQRTIGRLANGEPIAVAVNVTTAFPIVSAGQATADLADGPSSKIDDGIVDICVQQPDHRIVAADTDAMQHKMAVIPTQPYGMGLAQARHTRHFTLLGDGALFTKSEKTKTVTKAYKRTNPTQLFKTVRTTCAVADARSAGDLHWKDPRSMSILEIRRAQGIPDDDLLLQQNKADQWKLVGNAVARQIALALGLSLREAWLGTLCEDRKPTRPVRALVPVMEPTSMRRQTSCGSEDELGRDSDSVPITAGSPALTTTTTTTATLVTTLTLTTTTAATLGKATPAKTASVDRQSDDLPYKQNRIFQTSVRSKPSSSPAAPPSQKKRSPSTQDDGRDELSDGFVMLKRPVPRSWPPLNGSDDDDAAISKRRRSASSSSGGGDGSHRSQSGDRAVYVDDTDERCVLVID